MKRRTLRNVSIVTAAALLATSMNMSVFAEEVKPVEELIAEEELAADELTEDEVVSAMDDSADAEAAGTGVIDIDIPEAGYVRADGTVFYGLKEGPKVEYGNMEAGIDEANTGSEGEEDLAYYYSPSENRTRIMNQTHYGTCWTFGGLGAVEASVLKNLEDVDRDSLELSRIHFAYFSYMDDAKDPLHGLDGDSNRIDKRSGAASKDFMNEGGLPAQQITTLMNWKGAADGNEIMPYDDANQAYENGIIPHCKSLIAKNRTAIKEFVDRNGGENGVVSLSSGRRINLLNPDDRYDDMSDDDYYSIFMAIIQEYIDEYAPKYVYAVTPKPKSSVAWNDVFHVTGTRIVNDSSTSENRAAIKRLIVEYGAAAINYYEGEETNLPEDQRMGDFYSEENNSYYCYSNDLHSNHAIQVIGWDDNYSKENFNVEPAGDGAWIVKNSWMDSEETADAFCHTGIFYMSYYDKTMNGILAFDVEKADETDNNYQYDGAAFGVTYGSEKEESLICANVFKASASKRELLKRVAVSTTQSEQEVKVEIYKNPADSKNPTSGMLVSVKEEYLDYPGYRYIDLDTPVVLNKGEKFAVVVTLSRAGSEAKIDAECNLYESKAAIKSGRSFVVEDGAWVDMKAYASRGIGNLRIKAYTDNISTENINVMQSGSDTVALTEMYNKGKLKKRVVNADDVSAGGDSITINAGAAFTIKSLSGAELTDFAIVDDSQGEETIKSEGRKSASGQVSKSGAVKTKVIRNCGSYSMIIEFKQGGEQKELTVNVENIGFDGALKTETSEGEPITVNLSLMTEEEGYSGDEASFENITWSVNAGKKGKLAATEVSADSRTLTIYPNESVRGKVKIKAVVNGRKYSTYVKVDTRTAAE